MIAADCKECGSADIISVIPAVIPASSQTDIAVTHGDTGIGIPRRLSARQGDHEICTQPITDGCNVTRLLVQSSTPGLIRLQMDTESGACLSRGPVILVVPQEVAEEMMTSSLNVHEALCNELMVSNTERSLHPDVRSLEHHHHELVRGVGRVVEAATQSIETGSDLQEHAGMLLESVLASLLIMEAYRTGEYLLKLARDAGLPILVRGTPIEGDFNLRELRDAYLFQGLSSSEP